MLSREEFEKKWQNEHFPTMDLMAEMPFYYDLYQKIYTIAEQRAKHLSDFYVIEILMYIENEAHLELDSQYAQIYRRVEDMIGHWCNLMEVSTDDKDKIRTVAIEGIKNAPESGLVKWIHDCVVSKDFKALKSVALYFAHQDMSVSLLHPNSHYREEVFLELFGENKEIARTMVSSDFAFNWKDKEGMSVMQRLGLCFEKLGDTEVAHSLSTVRGIRLNCYRVVSFEGNKLTLMNNDNEIYSPVVISTPLPTNFNEQAFICQLVGWKGKYYINGSGLWIDKSVYERWDNKKLWDGIEADERDDCSCSYFVTPSGDKVSCYEDAYGEEDLDEIPGFEWWDASGYHIGEDPMEAEDARKRKRNKEEGRKQPNYKYKPTGKNPSQYFTKKINEVFKWTVEDVNDLNYGLRVLEGWMKQAHIYLDEQNYIFAHFISAAILFCGANYSDWYMEEYPKQASRMKKIVKDGYDVVMKTLSHDLSNWREVQLLTFKQMKSYGWKIFEKHGAFDLDKAIKEVEEMLHK